MMDKNLSLFINEKDIRLDLFLVKQISDMSRARIQGLIKDGFVKINGVTVQKASLKISTGEVIEIRIPPNEPTDLEPENIPLDIIFENDDLLIINKPAGMVVHPSAGHASGTLAHAALGHAPDIEGIGGVQRPGIVHRLDKDTSGVIAIAKNDRSHQWLQDQFRLRQVKKTYVALVDGHPPTPKGRIDAAIGRDPSHRKQMAVVSEGKGRSAITDYQTLETFQNHTLLELKPLTGRTHQIRLHLKLLGTPIVGDRIYGHRYPSRKISRHFLHAKILSITLPNEQQAREFYAELPVELEELLKDLRKHDS